MRQQGNEVEFFSLPASVCFLRVRALHALTKGFGGNMMMGHTRSADDRILP